MTTPTGEPVLFLAPLWSGHPAQGETLIKGITAFVEAMTLHQGWGIYRETFDEESDKAWPTGRH